MKTVPEPADVTLTVTARVQHLCPHVDEIDHGAVSVTWSTDGATFELHALRDYLASWASTRISHESLTDTIRAELAATPGVHLLAVHSSWETAGMDVSVTSKEAPDSVSGKSVR